MQHMRPTQQASQSPAQPSMAQPSVPARSQGELPGCPWGNTEGTPGECLRLKRPSDAAGSGSSGQLTFGNLNVYVNWADSQFERSGDLKRRHDLRNLMKLLKASRNFLLGHVDTCACCQALPEPAAAPSVWVQCYVS